MNKPKKKRDKKYHPRPAAPGGGLVAYALNMATVLAEQGIGAEHEADLVRALDGTFRAKVRSEKTQNYRLDGEAMTDIKHALQVHDGQMEIATRAEILQARDTILKRLNEGNVYELPQG